MRGSGLLPFVLGAMLGIAVGVGIGLAIPQTPSDAAGGADGGRADDVPSAAATPDPSRPARRGGRAAADPLAGLLAAGTADPAPAGSGVIRGAVRDPDGRGVPGVTIEVEPSSDDVPDPPDAPEAATAEERLRREVAQVVEAFRWKESRRRTIVTGPDGTFEAAGIGDGRYRVDADAPGWDFDRVGDVWVRAGAVCNFRGVREIAVAFDVRMPDGTAAEEAGVMAEKTARGGSWSRNWTPSEPALELPAGEYFVRARSGEFDEWSSERRVVSVPDGAAIPPVRLDLAPRRGFGGRVLAPPDEATAPDAVWIAYARLGGTAAPDDAAILRSGDDTWAEPGDTWSWFNVESGRYAVVAAVRGRRVIWRREIEVGDAFVRCDVPVPGGDLGDTIVARALAPDGTPVEDVEWATGVEDDQERNEAEIEARPLGEGRFRLRLCEPDAPNDGRDSSGSVEDGPSGVRRRWVKATSPKYGEARADHAAGDRGEVVVRFAPAAAVEIVVDGQNGRTMRCLRLRLEIQGADRGYDWDSRRDENPGTIRFGPVPAGPATLTVRIYCQDGDELHVAERALTLAPGVNRVPVALPATQRVAVRADAPGADLELSSVDPADGQSRAERVDGDEDEDERTFTWENVPHGRYVVRDWDFGEMTLTVPCAEVVRFVPRPYAAFRVNLAADDEEDAEMRDAGLRDGDVCVAVNGAAFAGGARISTLLTAAGLDAAVRLTILRGAQRQDVEFPSKLLDDLDWDPVAQ